MRIAIMQPYFYPYAGYFRLFAATDLFVLLDNVQFPRRGWVHRNRFSTAAGTIDWLTLPLTKSGRAATIAAQGFRDDAEVVLRAAVRRFPALATAVKPEHEHAKLLYTCDCPLADYLERQLAAVCARLRITTPTIRASSLDLSSDLQGTARLIAIARHLGADTYVNAPGGRALYQAEVFTSAGINLHFLPEFRGNTLSILERLATGSAPDIRQEIDAQCDLS
jgi:hypothetical protein